MKKKFEIIEEGRLSKSAMSCISGGLKCLDNGYTVVACADSYSKCAPMYVSCIEKKELSCIGAYTGPTGPDGYSVVSEIAFRL
jgi:hypothetical protein